MRKNENIKNYTVSELQEMRRKGHDLSDWQKLEMMSDEDLEEIVAQDPEENELEIDWDSASVTLPVKKQQLTLRIDNDIIEFFKEQGKGYQTMMNNVLRSYMYAQQNA